MKKFRENHKDEIREKQAAIRLALKLKAYSMYGGCGCVWCGEDDILTLCIDHVNNNGNKHKDAKGYLIGSSRLYTWLKKHNYPPGFQVLCFNCNQAKRINKGILPVGRKNLHSKEGVNV